MTKLVNKITGAFVKVTATCNHPDSHYGHAVWVDKDGQAYCEVGDNPVYDAYTDTEEARKRMGRRIAELREETGLSQSQLALATGLRQQHISRIEKGEYSVGLDTLEAIAEAVGKKIDIV